MSTETTLKSKLQCTCEILNITSKKPNRRRMSMCDYCHEKMQSQIQKELARLRKSDNLQNI